MKFDEIIDKQEIEDLLRNVSEEMLVQKFKNEYENFEEMLYFLHNELKMTPTEFLNCGSFDFGNKIIPIRRETEFKIRKHTKFQKPYLHSHSFYELIYVLKGKCIQEVNNKRVEIIKNEAILICPTTCHKLDKAVDDEIIFKLHIPKTIFENSCNNVIGKCQTYKLYHNANEQVMIYILKLLYESESKNKFSSKAIESYLTLLFIELEREKQEYSSKVITELESYLQDNFAKANLSEFSNILGYNVIYTGKLIKKYSGKSFSQFATDYKMKIVIKLLVDTEMSIENIAHKVGYENTSGLFKRFYNYYGVTPTDYRKAIN